MPHAFLAALLVASTTLAAQTPPPEEGASADPATRGAGEAPAGGDKPVTLDEVREEVRAQLATQGLAAGWEEEWSEERRKLELFTLDGYLRLRPTLFNKLDLNREQGADLIPRSPRDPDERTQAGANMRVRLMPSFNLSEDVRIKLQVDALDNLLFGSTPETALTASDRNVFTIFGESQNPPQAGINALRDSIRVRRAYGEVSTPVGILRFGRMGSHWGLGMLRNDGDCLDCDFGDTVDRIQFVTEPKRGWYVAPMLDFNAEGPSSDLRNTEGEPRDLTQSDDAHSWVLAVARRDTEQQTRAKLEAGRGVLNFGLHFTYRTQRFDAVGFQGGTDPNNTQAGLFVPRRAALYVPDVWVRYERRRWRLELEAAAQLGNVEVAPGDPSVGAGSGGDLSVVQFGAVGQAEWRVLDERLKLALELGYASGDTAPGLGNAQRSQPQFRCTSPGCDVTGDDDDIRNFRFNRAHRIDLILWREILGGVTDAVYARPSITYSLAAGFDLFGALIYSQTLFEESSPSGTSRGLGLELNLGTRYETEDGFVAGLAWGLLIPFDGLQSPQQLAGARDLENAQALRGFLGIKF